jgi:hypothetical protein
VVLHREVTAAKPTPAKHADLAVRDVEQVSGSARAGGELRGPAYAGGDGVLSPPALRPQLVSGKTSGAISQGLAKTSGTACWSGREGHLVHC